MGSSGINAVLHGSLPERHRRSAIERKAKLNNILTNIEVVGDVRGRIEVEVDDCIDEPEACVPQNEDIVPEIPLETKPTRPGRRKLLSRLKISLMTKWLRRQPK